MRVSLKNTLRKFDEEILSQNLDLFKIADMRSGKKNDDGYRGIHLYYQKTNRHYPIEIQINSKCDRELNDWLHIYLYKHTKNNSLGVILRKSIITMKYKMKRRLRRN